MSIRYFKYIFVVIALTITSLTPCVAQTIGKERIEESDVIPARPLFGCFLSKNTTPKRDPFETEAQFKARLPQPLAGRSLWYIPLGTRGTKRNLDFVYIAEKQELTIKADGLTDYYDPMWFIGGTDGIMAFQVDTFYSDSRYYTGKNAFGTKKRIHSFSIVNYVLRIVNGNEIPKQVSGSSFYEWDDSDYKRAVCFNVKTTLSPASAKRLVNRSEVLLGVEPTGYGNCGFALESEGKPTISDPYDINTYRCHLSVRLREIVLRDRESKIVYQRIRIKPKQDSLLPLTSDVVQNEVKTFPSTSPVVASLSAGLRSSDDGTLAWRGEGSGIGLRSGSAGLMGLTEPKADAGSSMPSANGTGTGIGEFGVKSVVGRGSVRGGVSIVVQKVGQQEDRKGGGPIQVRPDDLKDSRKMSVVSQGESAAKTNARATRSPRPRITEEMKASAQRSAVVEFTIGSNGSASYRLATSSGSEGLDAAVLAACAGYKWMAATSGGTPVASKMIITFNPNE